jgi:hypothetical protein
LDLLRAQHLFDARHMALAQLLLELPPAPDESSVVVTMLNEEKGRSQMLGLNEGVRRQEQEEPEIDTVAQRCLFEAPSSDTSLLGHALAFFFEAR